MVSAVTHAIADSDVYGAEDKSVEISYTHPVYTLQCFAGTFNVLRTHDD